jgi:polyhydroxyalkanoate synthesis regulator phasin
MNPEQLERTFKLGNDKMREYIRYAKHFYENETIRNTPQGQDVLTLVNDLQHLRELIKTGRRNGEDVTDYETDIKEVKRELKETIDEIKKEQLEAIFENVGVAEETDMEQLERYNKDLNFFLGIENPLLFKNPKILEEIRKIQSGDIKYTEFLKKLYKIDDGIPPEEANALLIEKLRQSLGLEQAKLNPLKQYRQASYIGRFTQSQNKKDWQNYLL